MSVCPCGSALAAEACCARYHAGEPAPTAEALMRSRYAAYVVGAIDYLIDTHAPSTRIDVARPAIEDYIANTTWHGLEIVATERGAADDTTGYVEFIARGTSRGKPFAQREKSRFRKHAGRWFYVDGKVRA